MNGTTNYLGNKSNDTSNTEKRAGSVLGLVVVVRVTFRSMVVVLVEVALRDSGVLVGELAGGVAGELAGVVSVEVEVKVVVI